MRSPFRDTVTLYDKTDNGYSRTVVSNVSARTVDRLDSGRSATVYMPLEMRRRVKYLLPRDFSGQRDCFTVCVGQLVAPYECNSDFPPDDALTVSEIHYALNGSARVRHLKIKLITRRKEEVNYEESDS